MRTIHDPVPTITIENPVHNQGYSPQHSTNPFHDIITSFGWSYSHTTRINRRDGTHYYLHTYKCPYFYGCRDWNISVSETPGYRVVASRGGKGWFELYRDDKGFTYKSDNGGGNLGDIPERDAYFHILDKMSVDGRKYKVETEVSHSENFRARIEKTKSLNLDQRIEILDGILNRLGITNAKDANTRIDEILNNINNLGYLPMMFRVAASIIMSRRNFNG